MYGRMFNDTKKSTLQTRHSYEQDIGYIRGLPAKKDFPSIFSMH